MSTIKVNSIKNTSTDDGGIAIDNSGHVQIDGQQLPTTGALSNRNLIINGAMNVAQRGTSFTGIANGNSNFIADRFSLLASFGTFSGEQSSTAPSGFSNSIKVDCTSANTSPAATNENFLQYIAEAQDLQQLSYGESAAKSMTLSFYVRSNKTGSYGLWFYAQDAARQYATTYTISTADTWELKTITVPGDASGAINNDNGAGIFIRWYLGAGTNYAGTPTNTWQTDLGDRTTSLNLADSTSNEWFITGVQLEVGEKATPFEHRSYGDELARCQRYYYKHAEGSSDDIATGAYYSSTLFAFTVRFPVTMRTSPDLDYVTGTDYYRIFRNGAIDAFSSMASANRPSENTMGIDTSTGTSGTAGHAGLISTNNASAYVAFDSEL